MIDPLRPRRHLTEVLQQFPTLARDLDQARQEGKHRWPAWCFAPMELIAACMLPQDRTVRTQNERLVYAAYLSTVAACLTWRVSQGVYVFDETLLDAIWDTPLEGPLPVELLHRLPEWCPYVAFPAPRAVWASTQETCEGHAGFGLAGFFVHLEWDVKARRTELRFLLDFDAETPRVPASHPALLPMILHLAPETTVQEAITMALQLSTRNFSAMLMAEAGADSPTDLERCGLLLAELAVPLVNLTLYLCAANADIRGMAGQGPPTQRPRPVTTKRGKRYFPPDRPTTWEVGWRVGAALRLRQAEQSSAQEPTTGDQRLETAPRKRPLAHVRRAHWHAFWRGPRTGERTLVVYWLPPIPVGLPEDLIVTLHNVKGDT